MMINRISKKIKLILLDQIVYFYYTAKPHYINPLHFFRIINEKRSLRDLININGGELYDYIKPALEKSSSTGCEYSDYLSIWNDLNVKKPKVILECGSGITTIIFAYYAKIQETKEKIQIISLEENDKYYKDILKIFPNDLKKHVEFLLRNRCERYYNSFLGSYYENIPNIAFDYIFIDGPTDKINIFDKTSPKSFNADIINLLLENDLTLSGLLDQRIYSLRKLRKLIPKASFKYSVVKKLTYFDKLKKSDILGLIEINDV